MDNHFHLELETQEPNLSLGMKWLQGTWSSRFNRFYDEVGRPFQGRYKAIHVEPGHALAQVAHYIHLNPVRAKIVPPERVAEYRWSSLWHYSRATRPSFLEPATILRESGNLADSKRGWECYAAYLALWVEEDPVRRDELYGPLSKGWCVGSLDFRKSLGRQLESDGAEADVISLLGADKAGLQDDRERYWEKCLQATIAALGLDLSGMPRKKSYHGKVRLAAVLKGRTAVSNAWLSERLKMGKPATASQYVRRFRIFNRELAESDLLAMSKVKI
jgi:hypothetical protein